ncbi:MAG TPA: hypothetical protein VFN74_06280 [Chloroflexota bacterium]|nr:hypothetical protein [Chloroflexota bacterium]
MLAANPAADVAAAIVWLPMIASDEGSGVRDAPTLVPDSRARHFYDPARFAGRAIARSLGTPGSERQTAWDMYLFYGPDAEWHDDPPSPDAWLHQLGGRGREWADPSRYRWSEGLVEGLLALAAERCGG